MNTLIKSIEEWVDQRVFANNEYFVTKFKEMEEIQFRHANRLADLDKRVSELSTNDTFSPDAGESMHEADQILSELVARVDEMDSRIDEVYDEMHERLTADEVDERVVNAVANRIADLERRVQFYSDSPSPESNDGEESTVTELGMRLDDMDSRLDDVESSLEDKIDTCDADQMVDIAVNDIDLESQIIDAVQSEIDAIDFKITVER